MIDPSLGSNEEEPIVVHRLLFQELEPRAMSNVGARAPSISRPSATPEEDLRRRLDNANAYFRRKASEILDDPQAMDFVRTMCQDVVVDIPDFDAPNDAISLAKAAAANFCEVGANVIFITDPGRRFVESTSNAQHPTSSD
jgi:hypothetical protein